MFDLDHIREFQIEVTSYCNAACPQCPRNLNGHGINPYMPLTHLPAAAIDQAFDAAICQQVKQIFFCGSYGDPIMHPDFKNILQDFRTKNPQLWLYIHTNGGAHDAAYWQEVAEILAGYGQIDFGIDGLEDTLHLYRRNVQYKRVIDNAKAFIDAGGRAQWNFIVFKHNQHQVDQVREQAHKLGFANVLIRNTGRFFNHATVEEMPVWPVHGRNGIEYYLEPPTKSEYRNASMMNLQNLRTEYQNLQSYFDTTPIHCDALQGHKVAVNAEGLVLPCNFLNHNLYDARFHDNSLPGANELSKINGQNQVQKFIEKYGKDNLNIQHRSLQQIFDNAFWQDLVESFTGPNRLFECAMTCGKKLTKVWDQGGSTR